MQYSFDSVGIVELPSGMFIARSFEARKAFSTRSAAIYWMDKQGVVVMAVGLEEVGLVEKPSGGFVATSFEDQKSFSTRCAAVRWMDEQDRAVAVRR